MPRVCYPGPPGSGQAAVRCCFYIYARPCLHRSMFVFPQNHRKREQCTFLPELNSRDHPTAFIPPSLCFLSPSNFNHQAPQSFTSSPIISEVATMRFLPTVTALTGAALTGATPTGLPTAQLDLSKYNLSDCTETYLPYIARVMTGIEYDEERKYAYCVVTTSNDTFFDYKCLCRGGDGEGSAIMDKALLDGQVWLNCGWDYTFGTSSCHRAFLACKIFCAKQSNQTMSR